MGDCQEAAVTDAITCPKCHKFITEPRLLQCLHACCRNCAEAELLSGAEHVAVRCPQCRSLTPQPSSKLPALPYVSRMKDWYVRSDVRSGRCEECNEQRGSVTSYCKECAHFICQECVRLHGRMKVLASHTIIAARDYEKVLECQAQSLNGTAPSCPTHGQPLVDYCETSGSLHCRLCGCEGETPHETKPVEVASNTQRTELQASLMSATAHQSSVHERLTAIAAIKGKVCDQQSLIHTVLDTSFSELAKKLEELKKALVYSVDLDTAAILVQLENEKGLVESKLKETEHVTVACKRCLTYSSNHEILALWQQLQLGMQDCSTSMELITETAMPSPVLILQQSCGDAILEVCRNHLSQYHLPDVAQLVIKGEGIGYVEVGAQTQFTIRLVCASGHPCIEKQPVMVEITYPRTGVNVPVEVSPCLELGTYTVKYTPELKGQYQVCVRFNDKEVPCSPFYPVAISSHRDYSSPLTILSVEWAWGVACSVNRHVYVTQNSHGTVMVLNKEGKPLRTLYQKGQRAGYLWYPTGIAVNKQGHLFICDGKENGRVQKLSEKGQQLAVHGNMNHPCGIFLSQTTGLLYVCDKKNGRVVVLDEDLQLITVLGEKQDQSVEVDYCHVKSTNGDMKAPHAVAEDDSGNIYVTDTEKHCIHIYDRGNFKRVITKPSSMQEEFSPAGICIQGKFLYVSDVVLNTLVTLQITGELVSVSGGFGYNPGQFYTPQSLQLDIDGYLHVCDYGNSRVLVF